MFKLGYSSLACPQYSVEQLIALATENGYAGVELRFVRGTFDLTSLEEFSPARIADTRKLFVDAGLEVPCIDTSVRQSALDEATREQHRAMARSFVKIAVGLGSPCLRVFAGPIPAGQDPERTTDAIAAGLALVANEAAESGVTVVLESHDDFSTSDSILDLMDRGAGPNLRVLWDTLHTYRHGESPEYTWSKIGHLIRHVHVKDSHVANANGFDFALAGEGIIPIDDILGVLRANDYDGFVDFEWEKAWHPEIEAGEIAVPQFARYMSGRI